MTTCRQLHVPLGPEVLAEPVRRQDSPDLAGREDVYIPDASKEALFRSRSFLTRIWFR